MAPHIVVVEDDAGIGSSLARTLEGQGYEVSWETTGAEGLEAVRASTALVILDLGLPDQDGLELCRRLRAGFAAPQVLILTARGEEADVVLGLDAGADDYMVKPFRLAGLPPGAWRLPDSWFEHVIAGHSDTTRLDCGPCRASWRAVSCRLVDIGCLGGQVGLEVNG